MVVSGGVGWPSCFLLIAVQFNLTGTMGRKEQNRLDSVFSISLAPNTGNPATLQAGAARGVCVLH